MQKKLTYEKLSEKVGTGGTTGTDQFKRECGKCSKFRRSFYPACSFPDGIANNGKHCDYAENCQDYEGIEQLPRDESGDYPEPGEPSQ